MNAQTNKLSAAAIALLTQASQCHDRLVPMLANLPPAARNAVVKRLLRDGLLEEMPAPPDLPGLPGGMTSKTRRSRFGLPMLAFAQ
jgi:hypothetical protein